MIQFEENALTEARKDGQTLLHRTIPATAEGPKWLKKLLIFRPEGKKALKFTNFLHIIDLSMIDLFPITNFKKIK